MTRGRTAPCPDLLSSSVSWAPGSANTRPSHFTDYSWDQCCAAAGLGFQSLLTSTCMYWCVLERKAKGIIQNCEAICTTSPSQREHLRKFSLDLLFLGRSVWDLSVIYLCLSDHLWDSLHWKGKKEITSQLICFPYGEGVLCNWGCSHAFLLAVCDSAALSVPAAWAVSLHIKVVHLNTQGGVGGAEPLKHLKDPLIFSPVCAPLHPT